MSRSYPYPFNAESTNILFITDIHHGRRPAWTPEQLMRAGKDIDRLAWAVDVIVSGGDNVNWNGSADLTLGPEDYLALPWFQQRKTANDAPLVSCYGNHDMSCWEPPYNRRNVKDLERIFGFKERYTQDIKNIRLIVVSPKTWWDDSVNDFGLMKLESDTVAWIESELKATDKPCWIVTHSPPVEHFPGHTDAVGLSAVIGRNANVMGWLSGHRHPNIKTTNDHAKIVSIGGRKIYSVNGVALGGAISGVTNGAWDNLCSSTIVSVNKDGTIRLSFREHLNAKWMKSPSTSTSDFILNSGYGELA